MNPQSPSFFSYTASALQRRQHENLSPNSLPSYITSAYSEASMNSPSSSFFSYTTSACSKASMNRPSPSLTSSTKPQTQWSQHENVIPTTLFSYTTSAYSKASMNSPSPSFFSYTTSACSKASMNRPSPSLTSSTKPQTQWSQHENVIPTTLFSYSTSAYSGASQNSPSSPSLLNLSLQWSQQEPAVLPLPTQPQPTVKPARTRRPPPPYSTSAYSEASKNPPSSPSLLNLSLQWSQQEPAVLPLPTQPQPTVKPARTRRPPPPYSTSAYSEASKNPPSSPSLLNISLQWSQQEPAVLPLPTQTQPTVKPARTRRPPPPYSNTAYSEASKNPPSSPSLLNLSLQWSQQEPAVLHNLSLQWNQHKPAILHNLSLQWNKQEPAVLHNLSLEWNLHKPATPPPPPPIPVLHNFSLKYSVIQTTSRRKSTVLRTRTYTFVKVTW